MRHFFNAAEPVRGDDIDTFLQTFRPFGFPDKVATVWGMRARWWWWWRRW